MSFQFSKHDERVVIGFDDEVRADPGFGITQELVFVSSDGIVLCKARCRYRPVGIGEVVCYTREVVEVERWDPCASSSPLEESLCLSVVHVLRYGKNDDVIVNCSSARIIR